MGSRWLSTCQTTLVPLVLVLAPLVGISSTSCNLRPYLSNCNHSSSWSSCTSQQQHQQRAMCAQALLLLIISRWIRRAPLVSQVAPVRPLPRPSAPVLPSTPPPARTPLSLPPPHQWPAICWLTIAPDPPPLWPLVSSIRSCLRASHHPPAKCHHHHRRRYYQQLPQIPPHLCLPVLHRRSSLQRQLTAKITVSSFTLFVCYWKAIVVSRSQHTSLAHHTHTLL